MSEESIQQAEVRPHEAADGGDMPAAKRPAARKTAKKAAKKTAAKKTARRTAKKAASRSKGTDGTAEQAVLPLETSPASPSQPELRRPVTEEWSPSESVRESPPQAERPARAAAPADDAAPARFGRVPGGGPVKRDEEHEEPPAREPREAAPAAREGGDGDSGGEDRGDRRDRRDRRRRRRKRRGDRRGENGERGEEGAREPRDHESREPREAPVVLEGPKVEVTGLLEMAPKGFGFLRVPEKNFDQARDDVFVSPDLVRRHGLRVGQWLDGLAQQGPRGLQLVEITQINGFTPDEARKLPAFEELKAINPNKRIALETGQGRFTTRVLDLMAPVGRGQRGLIVSPPRSGKTTLLLHIAEAVRELHDETLHLMVLLVDERPEEVTEFRRALPDAEVYASSNDEHPRNHTRIAELCIERAKRLVEGGKHVFLLMDSITRLARAYNNGAGGPAGGGGRRGGGKGRGIGSGGIMVGALETPRRLFAAARNTREGGSLTILATALVQTNSRADDAIFQEFKGTGNMELVLDRKIAENYLYPAVDIFKSGTRREELLLADHSLHKIHMIRRGLSGHRPLEAMERLLFFLKKFPNNPQMLLEIKG